MDIIDDILNEILDSINDIKIEYNSKTFNLKDPDKSSILKRCNDTYTSSFQN